MHGGSWRRSNDQDMRIRMDRENYKFLTELSKQGKGDLSKAVRELVYKGRLLLAVER